MIRKQLLQYQTFLNEFTLNPTSHSLSINQELRNLIQNCQLNFSSCNKIENLGTITFTFVKNPNPRENMVKHISYIPIPMYLESSTSYFFNLEYYTKSQKSCNEKQ